MHTLYQDEGKSHARLLLAVAGLVVAGAALVALLAGSRTDQGAGQASRSDPVAEPASYDKSPQAIEPTIPATATPAEPGFQVDPAEDFVARAQELYQARDYDGAAAYLTVEIGARPQRAWTHYMLGLALWKSGRLDEAASVMQESAKLDPGSIKTWLNLSRIQNDRGEPAAALEAAGSVLAIDPQAPSALYLQGRSLRNLGRIDEACASLAKCIELDPDHGHARNLLGLTLLEQGRAAEAVPLLERAASLAPEVAYIQNNLGMALELVGRGPEAVAAYRRAVEIEAEGKAATNLARLEPTLGHPVEPPEAAPVVAAQSTEGLSDGGSH